MNYETRRSPCPVPGCLREVIACVARDDDGRENTQRSTEPRTCGNHPEAIFVPASIIGSYKPQKR